MGKVKIVGYAQRVFFDDGIEYRNFSDDLVGNQISSKESQSLFTFGNFLIVPSPTEKTEKQYLTRKFSSFVTLSDINLDEKSIEIVNNEFSSVKLNYDNSILTNYSYFSSMAEMVRVSLENIIINYPASLYIKNTNDFTNQTYQTIEDYNYDITTNKSTFKINVGAISNKFLISYLENGNPLAKYNENNELRNLKLSYGKFVVDYSGKTYKILSFTGSSDASSGYVYFEVEGNINDGNINNTLNYHIRPNDVEIDKFFMSLNDFEATLLNRHTIPKYTAEFNILKRSNDGRIIRSKEKLTWNTSDGYNIDYDSPEYISYVKKLMEISENYDSFKTDLIKRFLVPKSITEFDSIRTCDGEVIISESQKINKLLNIYGVEFDKIKRYIDSISYAYTVTYNKKDNVPDKFIKNISKALGFYNINFSNENNLLNYLFNREEPEFSGHSVGYTLKEKEIEFWRRLILNSSWLWKSKGTRKAIDFILDFFGIPRGLIEFNEYVYKAKNKIDIDTFKKVLSELKLNDDLNDYFVDDEGYPKLKSDSIDDYFQNNGLWYRETAGDNTNFNILEGNNPHVGEYDGGYKYFEKLRCLINDFSPVMIKNEDIEEYSQNIFVNYNSGYVNDTSSTDVYLDVVNTDGVDLSDVVLVSGEIIDDPKPTVETTDCGCETGSIDRSIKIDVVTKKEDISEGVNDCPYTGFTFDSNGYVIFNLYDGTNTTFISNPQCCEVLGFTYFAESDTSCWWDENMIPTGPCSGLSPSSIDEKGFVIWVDENNTNTYIVDSSECCSKNGYLTFVDNGQTYCYVGCDSYKPVSVDKETGVVTFVDPLGNTTIYISSECCSYGGYSSASDDNGNYCIDTSTLTGSKCGTLVPSDVSSDGIILFMDTTNKATTNYVINAECCGEYGFDVDYTQKAGIRCKLSCNQYSVDSVDPNTGIVTFVDIYKNSYDSIPSECCTAKGYSVTNVKGVDYCVDDTVVINQDGDGSGEPPPSCGNYVAYGSDEQGLVFWIDNSTKNVTEFVSQDCCNSNGFIAGNTGGGNFVCSLDCKHYTYYSTDPNTGYITFIDIFGTRREEFTPECCSYFGYNYETDEFGITRCKSSTGNAAL
jgi:hypothetical protein